MTDLRPGWCKFSLSIESRHQDKPSLVAEWHANAPGAEAYRPIDKGFRLKDGTRGLKAKYFIREDGWHKWRERIDPKIEFDWTNRSPFSEWALRGFPGANLYANGIYPHPTDLGEWMFCLNPWITRFYYTPNWNNPFYIWILVATVFLLVVGAAGIAYFTIQRKRFAFDTSDLSS